MIQIKVIENYISYKKTWVHMSILPKIDASVLQWLKRLKYYNVLKWESTFTLELNAVENTDYIKKCFK